MTISRLLAGLVVALAPTAASAQDAGPKLPDYAKTPTELSAVQPTGGAGGSGYPEVQVVTILGDASKPGPYAQLLKVGANARSPAHHHAGDRVGTVLRGHLALRLWHAVRQGQAEDAARRLGLHRTLARGALRDDRQRARDRPDHR